jgi:23S rRNA (uridine2552-2'-O)-methyltransferase
MGAAPGGWSVIVSDILNDQGLLISIDQLEIQPFPNCNIIQGDVFSDETLKLIKDIAKERIPDIVLSDMMVNMCGNRVTDHLRSMELCHSSI